MTRAADDFAAIRQRMRELNGEVARPAADETWTLYPVPTSVAYAQSLPVIDYMDVDFVPQAEWIAKKS